MINLSRNSLLIAYPIRSFIGYHHVKHRMVVFGSLALIRSNFMQLQIVRDDYLKQSLFSSTRLLQIARTLDQIGFLGKVMVQKKRKKKSCITKSIVGLTNWTNCQSM